MRIDSSGKVGIGTTSPGNILHVHQSDATSNAYVHITQEDGGSAATDGLSIGIEDGGVNAVIRNRENGYLRMYTNNTERMRIDSSGKVGIGTTSPGSLNANANNLVVGSGSGGEGITIYSANDNNAQIFFADGTSGDAQYRGVVRYAHDVDRFEFWTAGAIKSVIDSSGNVGIGTSSPDNKLHVYSGDSGHSWSFDGGDALILENNDSVSFNIATPNSNSANILFSDAAARGQGRIVYDHGSDYMAFMTNGISSERMRITSSGQILMGITSAHDGNFRLGGISTSTVSFLSTQNNATSGTMSVASFRANSNSEIGSIQTSNTATSFNTSSDYRLKENIRPLENGLERLNNLNPVKFNWIADGISSEGFIAHEAQEVFPDAVTGEKDGEKLQGMDYGRITPLLVKAIQEQQEQIEQLKTEIQTLKGE
jgi:hypothetical protein